MIRIVVNRNLSGSIDGFLVRGHAGYAESGKDIICSAASAIAYTAIGYFEETYNSKKSKAFYEERDGFLQWKRPAFLNEKDQDAIKADAVLEAMLIGFKLIEFNYSKKYLIVCEEEAQSDA